MKQSVKLCFSFFFLFLLLGLSGCLGGGSGGGGLIFVDADINGEDINVNNVFIEGDVNFDTSPAQFDWNGEALIVRT